MRVGEDALLAAEQAAQYATPSAELYFDVSCLYAIASRTDLKYVTLAVHWLERASKLGLHAEGIDDSAFSHLRGTPEFDDMVATFSLIEDAIPAQRLILPF